MQSDIRIGYILTEIGLIFYDWTMSFFVRLYILGPLPAFYCEGILCKGGVPKQFIMTMVSSAVVLNIPGFFWLIFRVHRTIAGWRQWTLPTSAQIVGISFQVCCTIGNVVGFSLFGKDSDDHSQLEQEPEYQMFLKRYGTLIIFGPPGAPQYLKYGKPKQLYCITFSITFETRHFAEIIILAVSVGTNAIPLVAMMTHAMIILNGMGEFAKSEKSVRQTRALFRTVFLQLNGVVLCVLVPLITICSLAMVDTRDVFPTVLHPIIRLTIISLLTLNPLQFGLVFIWRNPSEWRRSLREFWLRFRGTQPVTPLSTVLAAESAS